MKFVSIDDKSEYFPAVSAYFDKVIKPIYGDQASALKKIGSAADRGCEVLLSDAGMVLGVLVYKKDLVGARNSLEVKTLGVMNPKTGSGKGYGKRLLQRALEVAEEKKARGIKLTLSDLNKYKGFFTKHAFKIEHRVAKKVGDNAVELHCRARIKEIRAALQVVKVAPVPQARAKYSSIRDAGVFGGEATSAYQPGASGSRKRSRDDSVEGTASTKRLHSGAGPDSASTVSARSSLQQPRPEPSHARLQSHHSGGVHGAGMFTPRPVTRSCTLMKKYVNYIASGEKLYEARCNTQMFRNFKVGDQVKWFAGSVASVTTKIIAIEKFSSFEAMLRANGHKGYVPDSYSLDHAIKVYDKIPGYERKAKQHGVVSFKLEVIKPEHDQRQGPGAGMGNWR